MSTRVPYTAEEQEALIAVSGIVSTEIKRHTNTLFALLEHLIECEDPAHRAQIVMQASTVTQVLLNHFRNIGWIEVELGTERFFKNPQSTLTKLQELMAAAEQRRTAQDPLEPQTGQAPSSALPGEEKPADPGLPQAQHDASMTVPDKLVTPGTRTLN